MRRLYREGRAPKPAPARCHLFAIFLQRFARRGACQAQAPGAQWRQSQRSFAMTRHPPIAVEIAAQLSLAAGIGLFVSLVLAGITMLLAA
jgi:hypothetical protein